MWQLKNWKCEKTQKHKCDKTQNVTKLKNSKGDKTLNKQKCYTTQNVKKLKKKSGEKLKNSKCDKT